MKHTEKELLAIKEEVSEMWRLVLSQLEKSKQSFLNRNINVAREIASREKRVDAFELKIDCDCENYIALYNPVAIDLRLVLSLIKITSTLERIADFCEGIARHVIDDDCNTLQQEVIGELKIERMFDVLITMLSDCYTALETEDTHKSGRILLMDEEVDKIYRDSVDVLTNYLKDNTPLIHCGLKIFLLIRKLERIGDHCSNIVEEIVFYLDAKVLKHGKKQERNTDK